MKGKQKLPRNRHAVAVRTMRKQVIASKKKYNRKEKHKARVSGPYSYAKNSHGTSVKKNAHTATGVSQAI